jgi:hypothetical protein
MKCTLVMGETRHEAVILGPDNYIRDLVENVGHPARMWIASGWSIVPERSDAQP